MSKEQSTGILGILSSILSGLIKGFKNTPEDREKKQRTDIELADDLALAEGEAKGVKQQTKRSNKINRRIETSNKGFEVEKLKTGKSMLVSVPGIKKKKKVIYSHFDGNYVYDQQENKYLYGHVYTWGGKTVMRPGIK